MLSILIVDDDADLLGTMVDALGDRYAVSCASDGPAAIAAITATPERFDLLITDLHMPGMTGVEVKQELDRQSVDLPMILVSSDLQVGTLATSAGFFDFLSKPLSFDLLETAVARVAAERDQRISSFEIPAAAAPLVEVRVEVRGNDDPEPEGA